MPNLIISQHVSTPDGVIHASRTYTGQARSSLAVPVAAGAKGQRVPIPIRAQELVAVVVHADGGPLEVGGLTITPDTPYIWTRSGHAGLALPDDVSGLAVDNPGEADAVLTIETLSNPATAAPEPKPAAGPKGKPPA